MKSDNLKNIQGYLYKIARNVHANFVAREKKQKAVLLQNTMEFTNVSLLPAGEGNETYDTLKEEVHYLAKIYREVIIMHYYDRKSLKDISVQLKIPLSTVKRRLYEAKNNLKKGFKMTQEKNTKIKAIKFAGVGFNGTPGTKGENINTYFANNSIRQNIAYSVYHEAKTISEIARTLQTPSVFIENEVEVLENAGYLDKVSGNKYQASILIQENTKETLEKKHQIFTKYAKIICDVYVPKLFEAMKNYDKSWIYSPKDDFNFLMWSIISFACGFKLVNPDISASLDKFFVRRKDGGVNIAFAWLEPSVKLNKLNFVQKLYNVFGEMNSFGSGKRVSWQFDTFYDSRQSGWQDNKLADYTFINDYIIGKLTKEPLNIEKFKRLYDKGYLITDSEKDYVNMIVVSPSANKLIDFLPEMPAKLKTESKNLDKEIFEIEKTLYPKRFHDLCKAWNSNKLSSTDIRTRILEQLVENNLLKPLTDEQKMSVNTIMFAETLPTYS